MSAVSKSARYASPLCVLVADDLSGACDAGVWFARHGLLTRVALGTVPADLSCVMVVSTDSRRLTQAAAADRVKVMAGHLPLKSAGVVFKKIDSTFRGHVAAECGALMQLSDAPFGVIVPAVPSQGRTVQDGVLSVQDIVGNWTLDLPDMLRQQGANASTVSPAQCSTAQELAACVTQASVSTRFVLCDATSEQELAMAAEALISIQSRPLWIGASGLASHAARLLRSRAASGVPNRLDRATGAVVLCVGSNHKVTLAQLERVQQVYRAKIVKADACAAGEIRRKAEAASCLVVVIDTGSVNSTGMRRLVEEIGSCSPAAILMTGGDTAALLCRAAEAQQLVLEDEVVAGVPGGYIEGGLLDGIRVATKSGGFGGMDCLLDCIHRLTSNATAGTR